jgi:hypothetical protein
MAPQNTIMAKTDMVPPMIAETESQSQGRRRVRWKK